MRKTLSCFVPSLLGTLALGSSAIAKAEDARPLRLETVDQVVERNDRTVQACGKTLVRGGTRAVTLRLTIDERGQVTGADAMAKEPSREAECLTRAVRTLHFPATGVVSKLEYPFLLLPKR